MARSRGMCAGMCAGLFPVVCEVLSCVRTGNEVGRHAGCSSHRWHNIRQARFRTNG